MPLILHIELQNTGVYKVEVRPDGAEAARGKLLARALDAQGVDPQPVGEWASKVNEDGAGVARTRPGVVLFAEQAGELSVGRPIVDITAKS